MFPVSCRPRSILQHLFHLTKSEKSAFDSDPHSLPTKMKTTYSLTLVVTSPWSSRLFAPYFRSGIPRALCNDRRHGPQERNCRCNHAKCRGNEVSCVADERVWGRVRLRHVRSLGSTILHRRHYRRIPVQKRGLGGLS
jgi:hypothetical protein